MAFCRAGGGGGGTAGTNGISQSGGAGGGAGVQYSISGSNTWYCGGGGGGVYQVTGNNGGGLGGSSIGGRGGCGPNTQTQPTSGAANTGSGGGGQGGNNGSAAGSGGSGIVIVRYQLSSALSVSVTAPTAGQQFLSGSLVTATVSVANGQAPYSVTFYTNGVSAWSTNNTSATLFTIPLGTLADGTYTNYATVTDNVSSNATSATNTFTVAPDTTAPTPNPMTFAVPPAALSSTSIVMTASTASDALSPSVEYFFANTTNSSNSGWISSTVWTNTGLTGGTTYGYRVKARDAVSNEIAFSAVLNAAPANRTLYWDGGTADIGTDGNGASTGGNGTWNTTIRNWDAGAAPHVSWIATEDTAIFGGAVGTVTLGEDISLGSLSFTVASTGYTISGNSLNFVSGGSIRAMDNTVNQTITSGITGSPAVRVNKGPSGGAYEGLIFAPNSGTQTLGVMYVPDALGGGADKAGVHLAGTTTGNSVSAVTFAGGAQYGTLYKDGSGTWTVGNVDVGTIRINGGTLVANGYLRYYVDATFNAGIAGAPTLDYTSIAGAGTLTLSPPSGVAMALGTVIAKQNGGNFNVNLRGTSAGNSISTLSMPNSTGHFLFVTKDTAATWTIGSASASRAGLTVSVGKLIANGELFLANGNGGCYVTLSGGELHYNSPGVFRPGSGTTFNLNGGSLDQTSGAPITTSTYNPAQTWGGNWTFIGSLGAASDLNLGSGAVTISVATRQVTVQNAAATLTVGGVISGAAGIGLTKAGPGTLKLTNANAYTGPTTVSAGALLVNGSLNAGSTVAVNSTGTLGGTGTVNGPTTIAAGGTLSPGVSVGTTTLAGGLTLNSDATLAMGLGATSDLVRVSGGTITGPASGTVAINVSHSGSLDQGSYTLIDWTGATPSSVDVTDFALTVPPGTGVTHLYIEDSTLKLGVTTSSVFLFR